MTHPGAPRSAWLPAPPLQRKVRRVGVPLVVLILLATVVGLIVIGLTALNPLGAGIGLVLSSLAMMVVVLAYVWLDRFEPEPPRLLAFAFLWGASVAVVLSVLLGLYLESLIVVGESDGVSWVSVVVIAPVVEEAAKGAFLLLMMTGRRRNEVNSLTDCLVYAGLVGAGFAWLEDVLYIASGESLGDSLLTAALRLIMAPFAHSLFTTFFGIGVYFALRRRGASAQAGPLLLGYLAAVFTHALWNGSSLLGVGWYFGIYLYWMMPLFALAIVLGVQSRRREQAIVAGKLPGMVQAGLVTPNEATWLGSLGHRKSALAQAGRQGGRPARKAVKRFASQVVELAFVRDRIDRGFGDPRVQAMLVEETYALYAARAAPALQQLAGFQVRPPAPLTARPGW
ncbi:PrsW family intramembrane metalloprotease [Mycolicibacterium sp. GF69]|uniref:PrsW family intramembrane metalloprotease n=1 Tax=Mycolicibacterium sp. GF69 TaxID=2267251 RepID=UPI000DCDE426|nr:PrsW family intramembrane metalloprotease [Mycolicibacterium sp. GF69]RAV09344.1 PrsW family intramembrane metalloprotease [Mycolicibacterium sp. GF69]